MVPELVEALALPASCRLDQRVPKKMLIENGAPTAADKRLLNDAIEEIQWIAALRPNTIGVPDYRDEHREYREVAVLSIATRSAHATAGASPVTKTVNTARLAELVHRAIPYPVLLMLATPQGLFLSGAHKRWAQNQAGKVVLEGEVITVDVSAVLTPAHPFMHRLTLKSHSQGTLMTLYQGWLNCLVALQASRYTGAFKVWDEPEQAAARWTVLRACQRLEQEAARLRVQAAREKQMARKVDINLALKRIQAELSAACEQL